MQRKTKIREKEIHEYSIKEIIKEAKKEVINSYSRLTEALCLL